MNKCINTKSIALFVVFAASIAWGSSVSQAFDGFGGYSGYAFPWFGYGNNGPAAYSLGNIPAPPYFALHPPVYYSHPMPRTYGQSPFACGCNCHHAGRYAEATRIVVNPHIQVPASPAKTEKPVNVAVVPTRLVNPFYDQAAKDAALASDRD